VTVVSGASRIPAMAGGKGTVKFALLQAPLDAWLLPGDEGDEALLLACSLASETVSRIGVGVHRS
jgi:hypothetical protein